MEEYALCTFCGRLGDAVDQVDERRVAITNGALVIGGIWYLACARCDDRCQRIAEAPSGLTIEMLKELSRVMRERPNVEPVEYVLASERARRAKEARASFRLVP